MKERLDKFLVENGLQESRERAKRAIEEGQVFVDGLMITSPAYKVDGSQKITFGENLLTYVSRGALKLEKAVKVFDIDMKDRVVLDIGSSTGGFTEISLLGGAKKVIALDVGTAALHDSLRKNPKVMSLENTDFRFVEKDKICDAQIIVTDVSFISLRHIFPKIKEVFGTEIEIMALFKPQFECGEKIARKFKGVIKDKAIHKNLLVDFVKYLNSLGFVLANMDYSPIKGKEGNIEYLLHIKKGNAYTKIEDCVDCAFAQLKK